MNIKEALEKAKAFNFRSDFRFPYDEDDVVLETLISYVEKIEAINFPEKKEQRETMTKTDKIAREIYGIFCNSGADIWDEAYREHKIRFMQIARWHRAKILEAQTNEEMVYGGSKRHERIADLQREINKLK